ncbi:hypothetical protein PanWU01x14_283460, partial [Parasponia andersonii]
MSSNSLSANSSSSSMFSYTAVLRAILFFSIFFICFLHENFMGYKRTHKFFKRKLAKIL